MSDRAPTAARVIRDAAVPVRPLFPASRLLKASAFESEQMVRAAREELDRARCECERMRQEAIAACDAARRAAEETAATEWSLARERGAAEGRERFAALISSLDAEIAAYHRRVPRDVQELALAIARRIIDIEFRLRAETILELVASALLSARLYREVCVVLSPADHEIVAPHTAELEQRLIAVDRFAVRADPLQPDGSVRLETDRGVLDASVEAQFSLLAAALADADSTSVHAPGGAAQPEIAV